MAKKILKTLTKNLGFKVLALIFAFSLWVVVYNIDDPNKTKKFNATVSVENAKVITEMNKCYSVDDGSNSITFAVTAKSSIIKELEDADFIATADMNNIIIGEDGNTASVRIDLESRKYSNSIKFTGGSKYMNIKLENLMSKQFVVAANANGSVADGYALGSVTVSTPTVLKVSGPESIVKKIDSAVASIDVTGMTMSMTDNAVPKLYDADGNEIATTRLSLSADSVQLTAEILGTKMVALNFTTVGAPAENNSVIGITGTPSQVMVKGSANALNQLTSIDVEPISVNGVSADIETSIDITEYLPEGVSLVNTEDANVSVLVKLETYNSTGLTLSTNNITVNGLQNGYACAFANSSVSVMVSGSSTDLEKLSSGNLRGTIDVSDLSAGTHTVTVGLNLDSGMYSWNDVTVQVTVTKENAGNNQGQDDDSSSNGNGPSGNGTTGSGSHGTGNASPGSGSSANNDSEEE